MNTINVFRHHHARGALAGRAHDALAGGARSALLRRARSLLSARIFAPALAFAALLAVPAGPAHAQAINFQPAPGALATPRVEEGGWAGFAVAVSGSAPSAEVTVNCVSSQRATNSNRGLITHLRADGSALDALTAGDSFPSTSITLGPSNWPSGQTLYCEFWTHDNEVVDGQRFFRMRPSITGPGSSEVDVTQRRDSGDYEFQIIDNDATPTGPRTLRFFAVGDSVAEGRSAAFDIVLSRPLEANLVIPFTITPTTPGNGITAADFTDGTVESTTLSGLSGTFTLNDTLVHNGNRVRQRGKFQFRIAASEADEMAESFTVTLGPPTGDNPPGILYLQRSATKTILADGTTAPTVTTISVAASPSTVTEGNSVEITFTLSRSYPGEVNFGYTVAGTGTHPAAAADFGGGFGANRLIAVPAGLTSVTVPLQVLVDGEDEDDAEEVTVSIVDRTGLHSRWPGAANPPLEPHSTTGSATFTIAASTDSTAATFGTVTISESQLLITQGGQGTYTVVLDAAPGEATDAATRRVTITPEILSPTGAPVTFSPAGLTFTNAAGAAVWSTPQTITVTAAGNLGEELTVVKLGHDVTTAGSNNIYSGVAVANGPVVSIPGVPVVPGDLTLSASTLGPVTQGATAQYTVALDSDPGAATVTVTPSGTNLTFSPPSVVFTTDGAEEGEFMWDAAQTITVTAANGLGAAATMVDVSHAIAADPDEGLYQGVTAANADLAVTIAGHGLTLSAAALNVRQGAEVTYTVQLDTNPGAATVTVTPTGDNLEFEPENILFSVDAAPGTGSVLWNTPQTFTVTAGTGLGAATTMSAVSHAIAVNPNDGPYEDSPAIGGLDVTIYGHAGLTLSAATLEVEQGAMVTYDVELDTDPGAAAVTVTPTAAGLTFNPSSIQFSTDGAAEGVEQWDDAQTVTVTATIDAAPGAVTVSHALSATGGPYNDANIAPDFQGPEVTITGPSAPLIVFTEGADTTAMITSLTITEGSPSDTPTYTVALSEDPTANTTVTVTGGTGSPLRFGNYTTGMDGTPNGNANQASLSLTFTSANYNTPQRVLVVYPGDDDGITDTVNIMHTAEGGGSYAAANNVSINLPLTATDDDAPSFTITGLPNEIDETPTYSFNFRVIATLQPPAGADLVGEITSDITAQTGGVVLSFSPSSALTFTNANWNQPQTITASIEAGLDSNSVEETITITVTPTSDTSAYAQAAVPATGTFLYDEVSQHTWTVRGRGQGIHAADVNENAAPLPNPNTGDPGEPLQPGESRDGTPPPGDGTTAEGAAGWMYFRFTADGSDGLTDYPHTPVTVTYCLAGTAIGGTAAQVAANPRVYDYRWPEARAHDGSSRTAYDPTATSPGDSACVGRGSFTTGTGTWDNIYRLGITLNDDNVDESDETITAVVVHTASADGHALFNNETATRTIKDNDSGDAFVRLGPKEAAANEGDDFTFTVHLEEAAPAELRVPWTTSGLSSGAAVVPASGTVVFAPGAEPMQEVALRVPLVAGLDSSAADQSLEIALGALAGPGAGAYSKQTETTENDGSARDITVDGIVFGGTSTVTISFISEAVQLGATEVTVAEGAAGQTYSVTLASDPGAGETVTVTPVAPAGLSVAPSSLTFDGSGGTNLWSTARMFTVTAAEDDDAADAALAITHTVATTQTTGDYVNFTTPLRVRVAVTDDDTRGVTVSPTTLSVPEGATGFYTVRLDTEPVGGAVLVTPMGFDTGTVTVSVSLLTFTDSAGASPWNVPQTVGVRGVQMQTGAETIEHGVAGADYGGVSAPTVAVTVAAAATGAVFSIAPANSQTFDEFAVNDEGNAHYFTVIGSGAAPDGDVQITCTVSGSEVTPGDFREQGSAAQDTSGNFQTHTLTFTPSGYNNANGQPCFFSSFNDAVNEGDEDFTVTISVAAASAATNATIGAAVATGTIRASDPITLTVARGTPSSGDIAEGASQSFTITPSGGAIAAGGSVTMPWFISIDDDGATMNAIPGDFRATAGTEDTAALRVYPRGSLTFTAAGAQTVTVHTLDDTATEPIEAFALHIGAVSAPGAARATGAPVAVNIAANDQPGVTVEPTTVSVDESATAMYTVVLNTAPTASVTVTPASGDTATATVSAALTFTASDWNTAQNVTVTGVAAGNTMITHTVTGAAEYAALTGLPSVVVTVNSPGPRFSIAVASSVADADADTAGTQVGEDVGNVAFTVTLSAEPSADATVDWAVTGVDTAADLSSYSATRTLTFTPANYATAQTVTLAVADDSLNEALETLTVTLSNVGGTDATVGVSGSAGSAQVQITDNDAITFTVARGTPGSGALNEGASQSFTITPSGGDFNGATVMVPWAVAVSASGDDTDAAAGDFRADGASNAALNAFPGATLSFTAATAQTVTVYTFNDATAEGEEAFDFGIGPITGAAGATDTSGAPQTITLNASDQPLTVTCTAVSGLAALAEGTATTVANCSHGNTEPLAVAVAVAWTVYEGAGADPSSAAQADDDFDAHTGLLSMPMGTASGVAVPLMLTATDDGAMESAEQFTLTIGAVVGNERYVNSQLTYTQDFSVAASEAAAAIEFSIAVASSVTDADGDNTNGVQVAESTASVAFTVSLANASDLTNDATVRWAVTGGTVDAATDLTGYETDAAMREFTFTTTDNDAETITLNLNDDSVNEATETLTVTLSAAAGDDNPTIGTASATINITDNDALTFTLARTTPSGSDPVTEGTEMTFTATMTGGTVGANAISLPWSVGGTAASGDTEATFADFDDDNDGTANTETEGLPSGTVEFPANTAAGATAAAQTFTVRIHDDSTGELEEAFAVSLGAATGTGIGGTSNAGTPIDVTIAANDVPSFSVTPANSETFDEFAVRGEAEIGGHYFVVIGSGTAPSADVEITCTVTSDEAVAGDFREAAGTGALTEFPTDTLDFTPSDYAATAGQSCSFPSYDDSEAEADEDFTVTITVTSGLAVIGTATAQGTILQNDFEVGFANTAYNMAEGEGVGNDGMVFGGGQEQVCVAVTNPPSGTAFPDGVTFALAVNTTDTGSAGSADYTAVSNQQVGPFNDSRRQECFLMEIAHDLLNEGAETFRMELAAPPGVTLQGIDISPAQSTVTIPANDPLSVTVTGPATVEEGASAEYTLAFAPVTHTSPDGMQTMQVTYAQTAAVDVTWSLAGTGITTSDFTGLTSLTTGNSHTIALASPDYTFDVAVADDGASDEPETFTLSVTGGSSAGTVQAAASGASASTQIIAAGSTGAVFTVTGPGTIAEGSADVESTDYTVTLSGLGSGATLGEEVTVAWAVTHGDTVDADFAAASDRSGSVMFAATADDGDSQTFTITIAADTLNEDDENFTVQVTVPDGYRTGAAASTTINDEAADATTVTISKQTPSGATVAEAGDGDNAVADVTFRVALSGGVRTGVITVPVSFSGLADAEYDILTPTGDYDGDSNTDDTAPPASATSLTLTFDLSGTPAATDHIDVTVNLIGDTVNEADETFALTGAAAGATGLRIATGDISYATNGDSASVSVEDDDDIAVTIANAGSDVDGDAAGHQRYELTDATFTVTLTDGASTPASITAAADVTIPYTISDADAADYTDRTAAVDTRTTMNGQLVIPAGSSVGTITIRLLDDGDTDATEDITVTLTADDTGTTGTNEGPSAPGTIALSSSANSATQKILQSTVTRVLTITAGPTTLTETDSNAATTAYTVTLTGSGGAFDANTDITWTVTHGDTEAADFSAVTGTVQFTSSDAANSTKTFTLTVVGDDVNEASERFTIVLSGGGTGVGYGTPYSVTLNDDDAITYSIAADSATVAEPADAMMANATNAVFTVTLSGASEGDVTIPVGITGSATGGSDYTAPAATVTITAGMTNNRATITIPITHDDIAEANEDIIATVAAETDDAFMKGAAAGAVTRTTTAASQAATVTISANDALSIAIARKSGESGAITEAGATSASFTVTVTGTSAETVSVPFTISGTNITADDYDITAPTGIDATATGGTLTIAAGAGQTADITVQASDDSEAELAETLTVTLTAAASGPPVVVGPTSAGAGTITITSGMNTVDVGITDNDGVTATIAAATSAMVTEGGSFSIPVTLGAAHDRDVEFTVAFAPTPATDNDAEDADIGASTGTTISSGATGTIMIPAEADTLNEGDETVQVTITATTTGRAGGPSIPVTISGPGATQTLTIQDDAADAITVTVTKQTPAGNTIGENGDGAATADVTFRVTLSGGTRTQIVTVPFAFSGLDDGEYDITTALDAADPATAAAVPGASVTSGVIHFTLADTTAVTRDISVNLIGDSLNEPTETLLLTGTAAGESGLRLRGLGGALAYAGSGGDRASIGVTDDDAITYSIADAAAVNEGDSGDPAVNMRFVVSLSGASAGDVTIPFSIASSSTATGGGTDYTDPSPLTVTVMDGATTANIDIAIVHDDLSEGAETIVITLGATATATDSGSVTRATNMADYTATGTINDDDAATIAIARTDNDGFTEDASGAAATAVFTVTISGGVLSENAAITFTVAGGTTPGNTGADYSVVPAATGSPAAYTLTITPGTASDADNDASTATGTITVTAASDNLNEATETVTITLTGASGSGLTTASGSATAPLADDDDLTVTSARAQTQASSVNEAANTDISFTVSAAGGELTGNLTVAFTITGTNITAGDYDITAPGSIQATATGGTLTIAPASGMTTTTGAITVRVTDDNLNEAAESLTLTLGTVSTTGVVAASGAAPAVSINANDPISVTIARAGATPPAMVAENVGTVNFTVTLAGGVRTSVVTVPFTVSGVQDGDYNLSVDGTALANSATGGDVEFDLSGTPMADDSITIAVAVQDDNLNEATETLTVTGAAAHASTGLRVATGGGSIGYAAATGSNTAQVQITDNDAITVTVTNTDTSNEADENATGNFRIALSGGLRTSVVTVPYAFSGTLSNAEYAITTPSDIADTATSGTITFGTGGTPTATDTADIVVNLQGDTVNEATEMLILTGAAAHATTGLRVAAGGGAIAYAGSGGNTATLDVTDDDNATATVAFTGTDRSTAAGTQVNEGDTVTLSVTLSNEATGSVTVMYTLGATSDTNDNDAEIADDLTNTSAGSITIDTGASRVGTITVGVDDDLLNEGTETFTISISNMQTSLPGGVSVSGGTQTFQIIDDPDDRISVTITKQSPADDSVDENGSATFRVSLSSTGNAVRTADVVMPFTVAGLDNAEFSITGPGTAPAASATSHTVTFPVAGSPTATDTMDITINLIGDSTNEATERLVVRGALAHPETGLRTAGAIGYPSEAARTVRVDVTDDDAITVTLGDAADFNEGENRGWAVTMSGSSDETVTINFSIAISDGTGGTLRARFPMTSGYGLTPATVTDAMPSTGSATISAGPTSRSVNLNFHANSVGDSVTGTRTVTMTLTGAFVDTDRATDSAAGRAINLGSGVAPITNANRITDEAVVTYRNNDRHFDVDLAPTVTTSGSEVNCDADAGPTGAAGVQFDEDSATARCRIITFRVTLDHPGTFNLGDNTSLFVDWRVTVTGGDATGTMGRDEITGVSINGGTFMANTYHGAATTPTHTSHGNTLSFARDDDNSGVNNCNSTACPAQTVAVTIATDTINEAAQEVVFELTRVRISGNGNGGGTGIDDGEERAQLLASDDITYSIAATASGAEGDSSAGNAINLAVTLSGAAGGSDFTSITIPFSVAAGAGGSTATATTDYTITASPLVFNDISDATPTLTQNIVVTTVPDTLNEDHETVIVTLGETPTLAGATGAGGAVTRAAAVGDSMADGHTGTATINDDDDLMLSVALKESTASVNVDQDSTDTGVQVNEGVNVELVVTMSGMSQGDVTVGWSAEIGTQTNTDATSTPGAGNRGRNEDDNADFDATGATISMMGGMLDGAMARIPAGQTTADIIISILQDAREEDDETVTVTLDAAEVTADRGVTAPSATATFEIDDNPAATRFLAVTVDEASREEGQPVVFTVTLTGAAYDDDAPAQTVDWCITGTAEADDYSVPTGTADCSRVTGAVRAMGRLDFGTSFDGSASLTRTVRATIRDDQLNEASETLIVNLTNITGGSCDSGMDSSCEPPTAATTPSVTVTIAASDPVTYSIASPSNADESANPAFTVQLSAVSEGDITVAYTIVDAMTTATGATQATVTATPSTVHDYITPDALTVTIQAGMTSAPLAITVNDDNLNEADETITVQLSDEMAATFAKAAESGAVTRTGTAEARTQTATIRDNDAIRVTVARTAPAGSDEVEEGTAVTFTVTLTGATAGSAGDVSIPWTARMLAQAPRPDETDENSMTAPDLTTTATTTTDTGLTLGGTLDITGGAGTTSGTVVITPAVDGIGELDERFTFTIRTPTNTAAGGSVSTGSPSSVTVGINENIAAIHRVNVETDDGSTSVDEDTQTDAATASGGGTVNFALKLSTPASGDPNARSTDLTVSYTISGTATGGASSDNGRDFTWPSGCTAHASENSCSGTETFTNGDDSDQTVTVNINPDRIDDDGETIVLTLNEVTNASAFDSIGSAAAAGAWSVTITDNDNAGITVQSGSPAAAVAADAILDAPSDSTGSLTYTVQLTSQPAAASVEVALSSNNALVSVSPATLTFNATGSTTPWSEAQTVTVTAGSTDVDVTGIIVSHAVTGSAEYASVTRGVGMTVNAALNLLPEPRTGGANAGISMDNPGIEIAGQTATYPIVLGSEPASDVTISFAIAAGATDAAVAGAGNNVREASPEITQTAADEMPQIIGNSMLTFTSANWDTPQNIMVSIGQQVRGEYRLQATVTAGPTYYTNLGTRTLYIRVVPRVNTDLDDLNRAILPEVARALADSQMTAIGDRLHKFRSGDGGAAAFSLGGQTAMDSMLATGIQSEADDGDGIKWKEVLGDSSFHMPLAGGAGGALGGGAFWGGGEYRSIGGDGDGVDWEGNITGAHLGFDARVGASSLLGLMVHYGDVEIDDYEYTDDSDADNIQTTEGEWTLEMTTVNPYFGWKRGAVEGWAMAGFGEGDLEIDDRKHRQGDRLFTSDVSMTTIGFGLSGSVVRDGGREVRVKAEAFSTTAEVDDSGGVVIAGYEEPISDLEVDANRVRVMVESSRTRQLASGADFGTSAEFGLRYDGGDGRTGGGSELGVGFHYTGAGGVSLTGRARGLIGHRADYDDWGVTGSLKLQPGADGQGLSLALTPAYGKTADGTQGMWDNGLFNAAGDGDSAKDVDLHARMELEAGYGVKAFTATGLLTPYSGMTFADGGKRTVKLGIGWQTNLGAAGGRDLGLDLSTKRTTTAADVFTLKGELKF